jgi:hypothetical protein
VALAALVACSHASQAGTSSGAPTVTQVNAEGGVACSVNGVVGTPLYSAWDAGELKAHQPEAADMTMLGRIKQFVLSKSLRYGYVRNAFIVFDADNGACGNSFYNLLNVPCDAYQPQENR